MKELLRYNQERNTFSFFFIFFYLILFCFFFLLKVDTNFKYIDQI